jgi:protein involved in polysaccharide export with SLBB domain
MKMSTTDVSLAQMTVSSRLRGAARRLAGALAVLAAVFAGCESSPPPSPIMVSPNPGTQIASSETNILQQGDVVAISFQYNTNYATTQKISLDGTLNLEGVGSVKCAGKNPLQLQSELVKLYEPLAKDDVITVKLISTAACVYISGAVIRPGKVPLERTMTVLEAIMEADGFDSSRARLSDVTVLRLEDGRQKIYHVNLKNLLRGQEDSPFYLKPFDIIHVPTKTFNF